MYVNFQHSEANCLHIFIPTKPIRPRVGLSVTPTIKKSDDQIEHQQYSQVLECPNGVQISKPNSFVKNRRGGAGKSNKFGAVFGTQDCNLDGKDRITGRESVREDGLVEKPDRRIRKSRCFEVGLESGVGLNGAVEELHIHSSPSKGRKNGVFGKEKLTHNGHVRKPVSRMGNNDRTVGKTRGGGRERGLVKNMQANCSMKCEKYGGGIPAMLEALETVYDLDMALKPWRMSLTNKERSILLKEQVRWERALEIFEWFKSRGCYEVNVIHYNIMLRILGKAQQWCEVERLCSEMEDRGIELINSTYGTLIDVYSKGGLRERALKWLDLMNERKMEPDEVTMGIVVQMYKKAGDFKTAENFFKKWSCNKSAVEDCRNSSVKFKEGISDDPGANYSLSTYTYNTLIDTYGKAGKLLEASKTFEEMLKKGILPSTVTFNSMIHMYGNNGQLDEVTALMRTMEKVECSPDTRTYNILISLHAKHNDIELAAKYLTKMKEASLEPDSVSYRTLLYAFSIRHMVAEAEELISEMDGKGLEIDEYTQSSLTRMYVEAGLLEKSLSWFQRFHLGGKMTSECYSANIDAFGQRGYILEAEKVFNCCLQERKTSVLEFNVMIKAYGVSKKFKQACCLFDSMKRHGLVPDRCSYNSLVQMLASADHPDEAKSYLRKMQASGLVIDCVPFCAVISSYAKLGQMDLAVGLYEEMIGHGIKPDVIVYGVLINAFAETGGVKEATNYVNAMTNAGLPMNDIVCKSLIKLYTKVGYLKEAQEAYKTLLSFEAGQDVYSSNCMIDLYSKRSMVSEAKEIFENLVQRGEANEFAYAMMLCMYKRNGRFLEAFSVARRMRELGLMTDLLSYNHILGLYASDGRYKEAAATFDEMLKLSVQPDDSTFKALGIILLKCGVPKVAIDKLEMTRKKDMWSGLEAWISAITSVIDIYDDNDGIDDI